MAQAHQDSSFELAFVPLGGNGSAAPGGGPNVPDEIPLLDLNSTDPLPDLPERPLRSAPPPPTAENLSLAALNNAAHRAPGSMWLQGDVLMLACPDCRAPMSVRTWLMVADCWKCRTSIELSEEQERQARQLLRERDEAKARGQGERRSTAKTGAAAGNGAGSSARQKVAVAAGTSATPLENRHGAAPDHDDHPRDETSRSAPPTQREPAESTSPQARRPSGRRAAAKRHVGARARIRKMAVVGGVRVLVNDFFRNMPAWLVSLVLHVVLLILLSLWPMGEEEEAPAIVLSTEISHKHNEDGDMDALVQPEDDINLKGDDAQRLAQLKAEQDARELQLNPNDPAPDLPPLENVHQALRSTDKDRASFVARDPRVRMEVVHAEGGTTQTEAAVARALRWLSQQQNKDGGWGLHLGGSDTAGTSLALLPFLGAGQTHETGIYQDQVAMGLGWLIEHQGEDGDLRHSLRGHNSGMYAHGQAAIVLSEAYALTGDEMLRGPAQKAIDFIVKAQHVGGGWRYQPGMPGDTSVLGWQLMALHSANVSGLNVPETSIALASSYLDTVQSNAGARYSSLPNNRSPSAAMTAEGLLCRMYTGWTKRNPALEDGLQFLLDEHMPRKDQPNIYYWYYGTQVAHHMGDPQWQTWNLKMREILVDSQVREGKFAGAWRPAGPHAGGNDWIYMTALATCCLEVYYRHVPLFRQIELEVEAVRAD